MCKNVLNRDRSSARDEINSLAVITSLHEKNLIGLLVHRQTEERYVAREDVDR